MPKRHVVLVFGYGCHLVPELMKYLDRVGIFCDEKRPDGIVYCGGFTQKMSAPGVSEAALMCAYVQHWGTHRCEVLLEEDSYTTPDNAEYSSALLVNAGWITEETQLTVFCEATRGRKVRMLVRHFFGRDVHVEKVSWEKASRLKQVISTAYDWLAIQIPALARYWHNKRVERSHHI